MSEKTRIPVLGAGYAGLVAAARLAHRLHPDDVRVTLVTKEEDFVERPRLHQVATGQPIARLSLTRLLRGAQVELKPGVVADIHLDADEVVLADGETLPYDRLVVALGSQVDRETVPGSARHTLAPTDRDAAEVIARRLDGLPADARVVVCGGGLTGIEVAAEVAESHPWLRVDLVAATEAGAWLSARARGYLGRSLDALRVTRTVTRVARVDAGALVLDDGSEMTFDLCLWAAGFRPSPLVAASGLAHDEAGRALVDRSMRSVSHPRVRVAGDAAAVPGPWGASLAMGCRTGAFTGPIAADGIAAELTGRPEREIWFRYIHECVSVGRRRGFVQFLDASGRPLDRVLTGRAAITYKNAVLDGAHVGLRHPGPVLGRRWRAARIPEPVRV